MSLDPRFEIDEPLRTGPAAGGGRGECGAMIGGLDYDEDDRGAHHVPNQAAARRLATMATTATLTAEDIARFPEDVLGELIRGEWRPMNPPGIWHGVLAARIAYFLSAWVLPRGLGEVTVESGYILERDPDTVVGPDVAFLRAERVPSPDRIAKFGPSYPDLAVEVVSPSQSLRFVEEKVRIYLEVGTPLVWVVHPQRRTVTVYAPGAEPRTLSEGEVLDGGGVLPGFTLPVAAVFA
jgi:Uma2 family endonuclease